MRRERAGGKQKHTHADLAAAFRRHSTLNAVKRGPDSRFYRAAIQRYGVDSPEWAEITAHMEPHGFGGSNHCVYAVEFADRHAYVGQTLNRSQRFRDHVLEPGPVSGHILSHPGVAHEIKVLQEGMSSKEVKEREGHWQRHYVETGWTKLWSDRGRPGALGCFSATTREEAHQAALLCKTRNEFWTRFQAIAKLARKRGWFDEITAHLPDVAPISEETRAKQSAAAKARPQRSPEHMEKMNQASQDSFAAKREDLKKFVDATDKIFAATKFPSESPEYKASLFARAKKFDSRKAFLVGDQSAYRLLKKRGWYEEAVAHMRPSADVRSEARTGETRTPAAKARMRAAKVGGKLSSEHRAKISASLKASARYAVPLRARLPE